jgi:tetratricopeptide (TPR) repeat protein
MPVLSWQSIVIGDPLYSPFGHGGPVAAPYAAYEALRQMNLLDAAGKHAEAIAAGKEAMKQAPSLALALALAGRLEASGNRDEGLWIVIGAAGSADASPGNWALLRDAAQYLHSRKRSAEALDLYRKLFDIDALPVSLRSTWLPEARVVALESGETSQAADWQQQLEQLGKLTPR